MLKRAEPARHWARPLHRPLTWLHLCLDTSARYPRITQLPPTSPRTPATQFAMPRTHKIHLNPSRSSRHRSIGPFQKSLTIRPPAPSRQRDPEKRSQQDEATSQTPSPPGVSPQLSNVPQRTYPLSSPPCQPGTGRRAQARAPSLAQPGWLDVLVPCSLHENEMKKKERKT
ncbi:uncharacterized protein P884DRAFT_71489 [Thermothelomyces heterothallicus CBS 202.75]|uniref:uncharacterized protein n=1 Tax=Thermothelomyces heterothallicus CBS 202.75 TaxID=1149848 RepID=UPI00374294EE